MARYPKGSKGNTEKAAQVAQPSVATGEPVEQAPEVKETKEAPKTGTIAPFDTCRYHKDFPPRLFKKGEAIPEGWQETRAGLGWILNESDGTWSK